VSDRSGAATFTFCPNCQWADGMVCKQATGPDHADCYRQIRASQAPAELVCPFAVGATILAWEAHGQIPIPSVYDTVGMGASKKPQCFQWSDYSQEWPKWSVAYAQQRRAALDPGGCGAHARCPLGPKIALTPVSRGLAMRKLRRSATRGSAVSSPKRLLARLGGSLNPRA
jgi:hypothetical protein